MRILNLDLSFAYLSEIDQCNFVRNYRDKRAKILTAHSSSTIKKGKKKGASKKKFNLSPAQEQLLKVLGIPKSKVKK